MSRFYTGERSYNPSLVLSASQVHMLEFWWRKRSFAFVGFVCNGIRRKNSWFLPKLYRCNFYLQLKVAQIEWNYTLKTLNEKINSLTPSVEETTEHPSRHQRVLKKRVFELERTTKHLHHSNEQLQTKVLKLEEEIKILQRYSYRYSSCLICKRN